MTSICKDCKHKDFCDETVRLYGLPNMRVDECREYKAKAEPSDQVTSKLKNRCNSLLTDDSDGDKESKSKLDLISREDVHKTLSLLATEGGADTKMLLMDAHEFIDALPSAEQVTSKLKKPCDSLLTDDSAECKEQKSKLDLIRRADAIEAVAEEWLSEASAESPYVNDDDIGAYKKLAEELFADIPSADRPIRLYEEGAIELLRMTGWLTEHDKEIGRPQGEWIITKEGEYDGRSVYKTECSECGHETFYKANNAHYCPNCGARMRGAE